MRSVTHKDRKGRLFEVLLPDDAPDNHVEFGVFVGPPLLTSLGLPQAVEVRLHNELFHRRIFTHKDIIKRRQDVVGALQSALAVDVERIVTIYREGRGRSLL